MTESSFSLIPFPAPYTPNISITGKISLQNNIIALDYSLAGKTEDVLFPAVSPHPARRDELWKSTCFEFFLAVKDRPPYWEFNLSPSGDWNVYHMEAYRRVNFKEEGSIQQLPSEVQREGNRFHLNVLVDLNPILPPDQILSVGITAVIQTSDNGDSYWALAHPASDPDFHLRESFIIELAEQAHFAGQSAPGG
jgi:hypothetical protein